MTFDAREFLASLTELPGVYRMLDAAGAVLYVGKAKNLKKRVSSYFRENLPSPRIAHMVRQIAAVETTSTRTEAEALLLENNLIKSLSPRYNILFRDDKSYPYIVLSRDEFPRLGFFRGNPDRRADYFGPYPSAWAIRDSIQLLQKMFRLRTCEDSVFANRSRPCLLYQIRRCSGPCVGHVSPREYAADVQLASMFLLGRQQEVIGRLTKRWRRHRRGWHSSRLPSIATRSSPCARSRKSNTFPAARARTSTSSSQCAKAGRSASIWRWSGGAGIWATGRSFRSMPATVRRPRRSLPSSGSTMPPTRHPRGSSRFPLPEHEEGSDVAQLLPNSPGGRAPVSRGAFALHRAWADMALQNGRLAIVARNQACGPAGTAPASAAAGSRAGRTAIHRIECFDISHTQGEATVASCVVYQGNGMKKADYRRFNIRNIQPGDDYAAMRQAVSRRYERVASGEGVAPDLILIDGGKGQVAMRPGGTHRPRPKRTGDDRRRQGRGQEART
jgi:excinuclease ABC subunit C